MQFYCKFPSLLFTTTAKIYTTTGVLILLRMRTYIRRMQSVGWVS